MRPARSSRRGAGRHQPREALAAVAIIIVLLILNLAVIGIVVGVSRDHDMTVRRMHTVEAMYAAEAGTNMSIRELMIGVDEDGDGGVGTISDDSLATTDPSLGQARFVVTSSYDSADQETTVTSEGRSGQARRRMQAVLADPP